jgi:hypothetical protein
MPQNSQISRAAAILMGGGPVFWKQGTENAIARNLLPQKFTECPKIFHLQLRFMLVRKRNPVFLSSWLSCTNSIRRFKKKCAVSELLKPNKARPRKPKTQNRATTSNRLQKHGKRTLTQHLMGGLRM